MQSVKLEHILFLDVESAPLKARFEDLEERANKLFVQKATFYKTEGNSWSELYHTKAGIWAEFSKVICICVGYFRRGSTDSKFIERSFYNKDEKKLLLEFKIFLQAHFNKGWHLLCAHNGKEFDFPFVARRMLVRRIPLPDILNSMGKKPWQIRHLDTMELWKFGDHKHYTSLDLLCYLFALPGPKTDLDGSRVADVYYREGDLERIVLYCRNDLLSLVRVYLRLTTPKAEWPEHTLPLN